MELDDKQIEKIFSSSVRLRIVAALMTRSPLLFLEIQDELDLTKGNLSSHMKQLEENGIVIVIKEFVGKRPQTSFEITDDGKCAFTTYVKMLESIIKGASV